MSSYTIVSKIQDVNNKYIICLFINRLLKKKNGINMAKKFKNGKFINSVSMYKIRYIKSDKTMISCIY